MRAKRVASFTDLDIGSDDEWWALARHFGLISPLLDWTRNPFVAAFFSFIDIAWSLLGEELSAQPRQERSKHPNAVAIWRLSRKPDPFAQGAFELIEADVGVESRQRAQSGLFTRLSDDRHFDVESYLRDHDRLGNLVRLDIPRKFVGGALQDLHDEGIHYGSLFPDFWGAAMYANSRCFVKPEKLKEILGNDL